MDSFGRDGLADSRSARRERRERRQARERGVVRGWGLPFRRRESGEG